jgi:hypothetical protein
MKKILYPLIMAASLPLIIQTASADVLLTDNFMVSSNSQNVNQQLATRQTGVLAPAYFTGYGSQHQVGNNTTDVGQPGGATNSNFVLLANTSGLISDLNIATVASGPLTIQFNMYVTGSNNPSTDPTSWGACTLTAAAGGNPCFPVAGTGQFGFLSRANGGVQVFNNGGSIQPGGWDTVGFATNSSWTLIFSDSTGTGSAFVGNGSQVTFINGTNTLGTITLGQLNSSGLRLGFSDTGNRYVGIANLSISGTPGVVTGPGQNLSFEYEVTPSGTSDECIPAAWTPFNEAGVGDYGSQNAGGSDYTVSDPLAPTADGNQYCYINVFSGNPTGGLYQDFGALQPNTIYTLTVAIGQRNDTPPNGQGSWSPGIISLVNGTDNTGTLLATGGGLPPVDTWQDYTVTYATGGSVSGDLTVMLSVVGAQSIQADFDNVRLTKVASVVPLPTRIQDISPLSATVPVGSNVVFTAAYSNSPPVSLHWQQLVSGLTNNINTGVVNVTSNGVVYSTLTLNNVQPTASALYRLQAVNTTNSGGVVYSSSASLTVIPLITWYPAGAYNGTFVDNTVFALAGTTANEVYGVDFGGSSTETTANGYNFDDYANVGNMSIAGTVSTFTQYLVSAADTSDGAFDAILSDGVYGSSANTGTLNNLTIGQTYTVLVVLDDTRSSGGTFQVTDGITYSPVQQYAFANGTPALGGYIMGTFTAQSTNQPLTVLNNGNNSQYNAILLEKGIAPPPPNPPVLTVDVPPLLEVTTGKPMTLSVAAQGALPLHYQWSTQSGAIGGATSTNYSFTPVAGTNSYYVIVTNSFGSVTSSIATVISAPNIVTVNNFGFQNQVLSLGQTVVLTPNGPTGWTGFNVGSGGNYDIGITYSGSGTDFTTPLTAPASGNNYLWINRFNGNGTQVAGIYQDVGSLLANTTYTLTVAIGQRGDTAPNSQTSWSPGIISLLNGTSNTGTVLATGGGIPGTADTWQDYTVSFTTGASVSGDLTVELSVLDALSIQADFSNVQLTKATVPVINKPILSGGNLILTGTVGAAGGGYLLLTTTNLVSPIVWTTNTTGTLDGTGSFSNAIPVTASRPTSFFKLLVQ